MATNISHTQRLAFITALRQTDDYWSQCFGEEFYQLHYSDLFTKMWLQENQPITRSQAYAMMPHLSEQTAKKYINRAIEAGVLVELPNPDDKRSQLIQLAKPTAQRLQRYIDFAIRQYRGI